MSVNAYFKKPIPITADGTIKYENPSKTEPEAGTTQTTPAKPSETTPVKPETYPSAWVDPYKDNWMGYLQQYENRGPFEFSANDDALYQQLRDQYIQQGQLAMDDAMGKAAAMTGGYGNSYAQSVGQQAFNQYLTQLNSAMPEIYDMAYDRYEKEGQDILNKYSLYKGLSEQDYENWYRNISSESDKKTTMSLEDQMKYENKVKKAVEEKGVDGLYDVGEMLDREGYSNAFITDYIASMIETYFPTD